MSAVAVVVAGEQDGTEPPSAMRVDDSESLQVCDEGSEGEEDMDSGSEEMDEGAASLGVSDNSAGEGNTDNEEDCQAEQEDDEEW